MCLMKSYSSIYSSIATAPEDTMINSNLSTVAPTFWKIMVDLPISYSTYSRWNNSDPRVLEALAKKMAKANVNPWAYTADARHFWQFADHMDLEFFWNQMDNTDHKALFGNWSDEDWEMGNK